MSSLKNLTAFFIFCILIATTTSTDEVAATDADLIGDQLIDNNEESKERIQRSFSLKKLLGGLFDDCGCENCQCNPTVPVNPVLPLLPLKPLKLRPLFSLFGDSCGGNCANNYPPTYYNTDQTYENAENYVPPTAPAPPTAPTNYEKPPPVFEVPYTAPAKGYSKNNCGNRKCGEVPQFVYQPIIYLTPDGNVKKDVHYESDSHQQQAVDDKSSSEESKEEYTPTSEATIYESSYAPATEKSDEYKPIELPVQPESKQEYRPVEVPHPPPSQPEYRPIEVPHPPPTQPTVPYAPPCAMPFFGVALAPPQPVHQSSYSLPQTHYGHQYSSPAPAAYSQYNSPASTAYSQYNPSAYSSSAPAYTAPTTYQTNYATSYTKNAAYATTNVPNYYPAQPVYLNEDDQPYRACPELFYDYHHRLNRYI